MHYYPLRHCHAGPCGHVVDANPSQLLTAHHPQAEASILGAVEYPSSMLIKHEKFSPEHSPSQLTMLMRQYLLGSRFALCQSSEYMIQISIVHAISTARLLCNCSAGWHEIACRINWRSGSHLDSKKYWDLKIRHLLDCAGRGLLTGQYKSAADFQ